MAEIPTFQAKQAGGIDARGLCEADRRRRAPARRRPPRPGSSRPPTRSPSRRGRRAADDAARGRPPWPRVARDGRIAYRDTNYAGRIGWKEIVVGADAKSRSDELRAYPKDLLQSPLDVTSAGDDASAPTSDPPPGLTRGQRARGARPRRRRRLREPDRPRAAQRRLRPALAADRDLLGRGARALPGPRQVDRRRLPRRLARHAAARGLPRADRDRHAHDRRLRARAGHAQPLRSSSSRTSSTRG